MRIKILVLSLFCFYFINCASAPAPRQIVNAFPINKPFDQVWSAVIETFSDLQLPIMNMEKDSGLITTDWIEFRGEEKEEYCDCGKDLFSNELSRNGKLNVFVKKVAEESCEVRINCMFEQEAQSTLTKEFRKGRCVSTGNLEAKMFELIKSKS